MEESDWNSLKKGSKSSAKEMKNANFAVISLSSKNLDMSFKLAEDCIAFHTIIFDKMIYKLFKSSRSSKTRWATLEFSSHLTLKNFLGNVEEPVTLMYSPQRDK